MNVLLLGATGFSGQAVLQELLTTPHQITLLTRDASQLPPLPDRVNVIEGSVADPVVLAQALKGQEGVLHCLGIGGKGNGKANHFLSNTTQLLIQLMQKQGVKRLIVMSNIGAGDSAHYHPWWFRKLILPYFLPWLKAIIEDKNRLEPLVQQSSLDWIVVRLPNIVDKPAKGHIHSTTTGQGLQFSITTQDTAHFLVQQLQHDQFLHQTPAISN